MNDDTCLIEGCAKPKGKGKAGYCYMHITRIRKHGDPGGADSMYCVPSDTMAQRLQHFGWDVTPEGCWEWRGARTRFGHGTLGVNYKSTFAHRASFAEANGPIPEGMVVCHKCDNPPCINPAHLFLGTQGDNLRDMHAKGRGIRGSAQHAAKLVEADIPKIHALRAEGVSVIDIAAQFDVQKRQVYRVLDGTRWAHIAPDGS